MAAVIIDQIVCGFMFVLRGVRFGNHCVSEVLPESDFGDGSLFVASGTVCRSTKRSSNGKPDVSPCHLVYPSSSKYRYEAVSDIRVVSSAKTWTLGVAELAAEKALVVKWVDGLMMGKGCREGGGIAEGNAGKGNANVGLGCSGGCFGLTAAVPAANTAGGIAWMSVSR